MVIFNSYTLASKVAPTSFILTIFHTLIQDEFIKRFFGFVFLQFENYNSHNNINRFKIFILVTISSFK